MFTLLKIKETLASIASYFARLALLPQFSPTSTDSTLDVEQWATETFTVNQPQT
jgi:hypothetical protein